MFGFPAVCRDSRGTDTELERLKPRCIGLDGRSNGRDITCAAAELACLEDDESDGLQGKSFVCSCGCKSDCSCSIVTVPNKYINIY